MIICIAGTQREISPLQVKLEKIKRGCVGVNNIKKKNATVQ